MSSTKDLTKACEVCHTPKTEKQLWCYGVCLSCLSFFQGEEAEVFSNTHNDGKRLLWVAIMRTRLMVQDALLEMRRHADDYDKHLSSNSNDPCDTEDTGHWPP